MTKIIKNSIITILLVLIALTLFPATVFAKEYEPRLSSPNGEPYYTSELNAYSQTGYSMPNCVAYVYGRIYEITGERPLIDKGDASDWWFINKYNNYYETGYEPKLGAVACWSNHVAVVEDIADDGAITLSESHWGGRYFNTVVYYDMTNHYGQTFYGYMYTYKSDEELALEIAEKTAKEKQEPSYKMEDNSFKLQEKNCFTVLEFAGKDESIVAPSNNILLNK
jgi:surface antigen